MLWVLGWRPNHPYFGTLLAGKNVFGYLGWMVFEIHNARNYCLDTWVAPQTPIPQNPIGQRTCFWIPEMVVLKLNNAKKRVCVFWVDTQNTDTSVPERLAKVFLDT